MRTSMRGLHQVSRDRSLRHFEEEISVDMTNNSHDVFAPSELEVDYDKNITRLYYAICQSNWDDALEAVTLNPQEAMTWVVRFHPDAKKREKVVKLRFLPLHSACARDPPPELIAALLNAYPGGVQCEDDRGMIPLHYSCANRASRDILRMLLVAHSPAAKVPDPKGMLALHYVACWGPSSVSVIDMLVVANRDALLVKDDSGKTPLDLANEAIYDTKDEVVTALKRWNYIGDVKESPSPSPSTRKKASPKTSNSKPSPTSVVVKSLDHHHHQVQSPSLNKRSTKAPIHRPRPPSHTVVKRSKLVFPEELEADFFSTKQQQEQRQEMSSYPAGSEEESELVHIAPSDSTHEDSGSMADEKSTTHNDLLVAQLRADLARVKANKCFTLVDSHGVSDEIKCYQRTINLLYEDLAHAHQETVNVMKKKLDRERTLEEKQMACYGTDSKLRDMTKLRDRYKDRVESMRVQMATLSASVNVLLKSQDAIIPSVNPRDTSRRRRKEKLEELLEAEEEIADDQQSAFEKQAREMKAIAAILKKSKASNA